MAKLSSQGQRQGATRPTRLCGAARARLEDHLQWIDWAYLLASPVLHPAGLSACTDSDSFGNQLLLFRCCRLRWPWSYVATSWASQVEALFQERKKKIQAREEALAAAQAEEAQKQKEMEAAAALQQEQNEQTQLVQKLMKEAEAKAQAEMEIVLQKWEAEARARMDQELKKQRAAMAAMKVQLEQAQMQVGGHKRKAEDEPESGEEPKPIGSEEVEASWF